MRVSLLTTSSGDTVDMNATHRLAFPMWQAHQAPRKPLRRTTQNLWNQFLGKRVLTDPHDNIESLWMILTRKSGRYLRVEVDLCRMPSSPLYMRRTRLYFYSPRVLPSKDLNKPASKLTIYDAILDSSASEADPTAEMDQFQSLLKEYLSSSSSPVLSLVL